MDNIYDLIQLQMNSTFQANIYDKEILLYVLSMYDIDYSIEFQDNNFIIIFNETIEKKDLQKIKKQIDKAQLRKDIANSNKKIREYIIATALWMPE